MLDTRIDRVSGSGEDALYNVYHGEKLVFASVPMSEVLRYLCNIHEDDADERKTLYWGNAHACPFAPNSFT